MLSKAHLTSHSRMSDSRWVITPSTTLVKNDRMISVHFQGKLFNIIGIQIYSPTTNAEEADQFYENLEDHLELTPKTDVLFTTGDWNTKTGSQEVHRITGKFGLGVQSKVRKRLTEFCKENMLVIDNILFQQPKRQLSTWTSPDGQYWNQITFFAARDGGKLI